MKKKEIDRAISFTDQNTGMKSKISLHRDADFVVSKKQHREKIEDFISQAIVSILSKKTGKEAIKKDHKTVKINGDTYFTDEQRNIRVTPGINETQQDTFYFSIESNKKKTTLIELINAISDRTEEIEDLQKDILVKIRRAL